MTQAKTPETAAEGLPRRLFAFNAGFWTGPRLRRILSLAGWRLRAGWPGAGDHIAVWGASPYAWRGLAVAGRTGAPLVRIEDAFLRSVLPGRARGPIARRGPIGLLIDPYGVHFDPARPSLIDHHLPRARKMQDLAADAIARLISADLSKYNAHLPDAPAPDPGYVLVVDQTRGDASLLGAGRAEFLAMLRVARAENPGLPLVIRSHPETAQGLRPGHFGPGDLLAGEVLHDGPTSPWRLIGNAARLYVWSSQLGYEAILAGHRPRVFGRPFYAGRGLSDDEAPVPGRAADRAETLFAASHLLAPVWYDPCHDRLTDFFGAADQIEAEARAWRQDRRGYVATGMRLWKRRHIARTFGAARGVRFADDPAQARDLARHQGRDLLVWAGRAEGLEAISGNAENLPAVLRVEDGFLRSRGLGAQLVPPLSLVADDLGIYYDPGRPSRFEALVNAGTDAGGVARAQALVDRLRALGVSKYNLAGAPPALPATGGQRVILVPGQVEDDASIRLGTAVWRTNRDLLAQTRAENPKAFIIYKPHPDVVAGLRPGATDTAGLADMVVTSANPARLLSVVDELWTLTSTFGFEALLRGVPVTCLGVPFYAGWGLTRDLAPTPERRTARPEILAFAHAALIAYPRYTDPVSGLPCPPEIAVERLADPDLRPGGPRWLAKLQGVFAGYSAIWRRG
ncbi:capsular polysaccharide biosynthesis protein [Paracoccus pacificus]|uniref:Capsular polysaccharide biosynthesis protein n=1 Tax=Paracoccus pacificus TaxID=1463598 RepID=A0ABW4R496_9RHOB